MTTFTASIANLCNESLTSGLLVLKMTQAFNVSSTQLAKFATPGVNGGFRDVVLSSDVVDRRTLRFAQDFYYLTFRKIHSLHSYR